MTPPPQNPAHLLPVGAVLTGGGLGHSYRIGLYLGQGGFGVTYSAMDTQTHRQVAIKEYFPTRCAHRDPEGAVEPLSGQEAVYEGGRYSFVQEARMLAALDGMPSVVQGLDYLEINNTAYLVMEYLDGTPLYRLVKEKGRITAPELLPRLYPLIRDMGRLHAAGVIHRDVSPDNVMWMKDGTLKLLDFGCARAMEDGKSMTVALKQGFAPVEQYRTHGQGPWTDVYALCATVYYCLTGKIPPAAPDRLMEDAMAAPNTLGAGLTAEEQDALLWGLTVDPKQRPASMELLAQRLFPRQWAADHPEPGSLPDSGPPPAPEPGSASPAGEGSSPAPKTGFSLNKLAGMDRRILIGITAAVLVLILILAFALGRGTAERPSPTQRPSAAPTLNLPKVTLPPAGTAAPTADPAQDAARFPPGMQITCDVGSLLTATLSDDPLYTAEDGALYGTLEGMEYAILLRLPPGATRYTIPAKLKIDGKEYVVLWVYEEALDGAPANIPISTKGTYFDFELYDKAAWKPDEDYPVADWVLSCRLAYAVNKARGGQYMKPSQQLISPAQARASEMVQDSNGELRPDGSSTFTVLDEYLISYTECGAFWGGAYTSYETAASAAERYIRDWAGSPISEGAHAGEYFDAVGAHIQENSGIYSLYCFTTYG